MEEFFSDTRHQVQAQSSSSHGQNSTTPFTSIRWPVTWHSEHWGSGTVSRRGLTFSSLYWWDGLGSETQPKIVNISLSIKCVTRSRPSLGHHQVSEKCFLWWWWRWRRLWLRPFSKLILAACCYCVNPGWGGFAESVCCRELSVHLPAQLNPAKMNILLWIKAIILLYYCQFFFPCTCRSGQGQGWVTSGCHLSSASLVECDAVDLDDVLLMLISTEFIDNRDRLHLFANEGTHLTCFVPANFSPPRSF